MEFYVGNARQAAHYYRTAFGFRLAAYRGPETGTRDRASYVLVAEQDPLRADHAAAARATDRRARPRCTATASAISRSGWTMPRPPGARPPARGARSVREPETLRDEHGEARIAAHRDLWRHHPHFVERRNYRGAFLPGFGSR